MLKWVLCYVEFVFLSQTINKTSDSCQHSSDQWFLPVCVFVLDWVVSIMCFFQFFEHFQLTLLTSIFLSSFEMKQTHTIIKHRWFQRTSSAASFSLNVCKWHEAYPSTNGNVLSLFMTTAMRFPFNASKYPRVTTGWAIFLIFAC